MCVDGRSSDWPRLEAAVDFTLYLVTQRTCSVLLLNPVPESTQPIFRLN